MRIEAHLPEEMWPESMKAARYLTNRTPSHHLDWKTPLEILQATIGITHPSPSIAHLYVYGCCAYPLIRKIPRTKKLEPQAHIGYLVGYESTNIFRIWVPREQKVIVTRDVTFDESHFYDPNKPEPAHYLRELMEQPSDTIAVPNHLPIQ